MALLDDSKYLIDLLMRKQCISASQAKFILQHKQQQAQKMALKMRDQGIDRSEQRIDLVDVIVSFNLEMVSRPDDILTEDEIIQTEAQAQ